MFFCEPVMLQKETVERLREDGLNLETKVAWWKSVKNGDCVVSISCLTSARKHRIELLHLIL